MAKTKPKTVEEYISAAPAAVQKKLNELRAILKKVVPTAIESIKWGNPVFVEKRILFAYAAYKSHLSFMPTQSAIEPFADLLTAYNRGKDTIQFPYDKPLPKTLIKKIATYRVRDVRENDARWM